MGLPATEICTHGNKLEWQFRLQNCNQTKWAPGEASCRTANAGWLSIPKLDSPSIQFQLVREMPAALDQDQELAHSLESVRLVQKCWSPVCNWSCKQLVTLTEVILVLFESSVHSANQYSLEHFLSVWLSLSTVLHGGHSHRIGREVIVLNAPLVVPADGTHCQHCCQAYTCIQQNYINVQWLPHHLSQRWAWYAGIPWTQNIWYYKTNSENLKNPKLIVYNGIPFTFECL